MTKPADSGQIAKARRECIKERVEVFSGKWLESHFIYDDFEFAADFAESERQAVIEECCRAVCAMCKSGEIARCKYGPPKFDAEHGWIHYLAPDYSKWAICAATAIRSMGE